jgi:sulfur-oxidizing protein SoxX
MRFTHPIALGVMLLAAAGAQAGEKKSPSSWGKGADDTAFGLMLASGFQDAGPVKTARLAQDDNQKFCSDPVAANAPANAKKRDAIEAEALKSVKWPADGQWLGDWKEGEKVAQSGRGLTWTDPAGMVNGGNCYNCHQITPSEISFGTIGPSLLGYGKTRGMSEETLRYTWSKIYNGKSSNACSNMPRGGHMGIITAQQIKDLMALLLDPASPVNK